MRINKKRLYEIIFEDDTPEGRAFDVSIIVLILISILLVIIDSIAPIHEKYTVWFRGAEWLITGLFITEYLLRIYVLDKPVRYIFSFFGIIDLLAILPNFIGLIFKGGQSLMIIRAVRLLRVFRIFKLSRYTSAGRMLALAMYKSREKIFMFLAVIVTMIVILVQ